MNGFFITGTDTGIGKTYCTAALLRAFQSKGYSTIAMKPIAAGLIEHDGQSINDDVLFLQQHASVQAPLALLNPYAFKEAIAPHVAAAHDNIHINKIVILDACQQLGKLADVVLIEGVGGFLVPLSEDYDSARMAADIGLPVILVVGMRLGCLNHALLTAEAIHARGLTIKGWIANTIEPNMNALEENISALQQRLRAPWLGTLPHCTDRNANIASAHLTLAALIKPIINPPDNR